MTKASGLLLIATDIEPAYEDEFNRWYEEEHLAERMAIPGFIQARRFRALEGSPKYLALYDVESPEVFKSEKYLHITGAGRSPWSREMNRHFKNFSRGVYVSISERKR